MTEENPDSVNMDATARDKSKLNQIGQLTANTVNIGTSSDRETSSRETAARNNEGDPYKSLAYWQGRKEEIAKINQYLADPNISLMGIHGIGGTGKSTLATKIFIEQKQSKRYWQDVTFAADFAELAQDILNKFGRPIPEAKDLIGSLIKCLQQEHCFLVIDNLESLLVKKNRQWNNEFYEKFFRQWIEQGGKSKILVTTREQPDLSGFNEWIPLKGLKVEEGVQLLQDSGIRGDLTSFSQLVDGHPLILRLVADFLRSNYRQDPDLKWFPALETLRELLKNSEIKGQHRQQEIAIQFVFKESFERLSEIQQDLLLKTSVYRGEFDAEMAKIVLSDREEDSQNIEIELKKLVKRSLLEEKLNERYFFEFQPVILEYIRDKAGEQSETHHRAIEYYHSVVRSRPIAEVIQEYQEIVYHYLQLKNYDTAFDTIRQIDEFLTLQGLATIRIELYEPLVRVWQPENAKQNWRYGASFTSLGSAYDSLGEYEKARDYHQQSLTIDREIGDRSGEGGSLCNLGNIYYSLGDHEKAINYYKQALTVLKLIKHSKFIANTLMGLGDVYYSLGEHEKAIDYYQQSLTIKKEIGDRRGEGNSLGNLGLTYYSLGEYEKAIDYHQKSLTIVREIGDRSGEGNSLGNLGSVYNSLGEYEKAIDYQQQSLTIAREIGDRSGEGGSLCNLGNIYYSLGDHEKAINYYKQALTVLKLIKHSKFIANTLMGLGDVYYSLGEHEKAIDYYQQSLTIKKEIGDRRGEGNSLGNLGLTYYSLGEYEKAIDYHQKSLTIVREIGDRSGEGNSLGNLGSVYNSLGEYEKAIDYQQQSLTIAREIGDRSGEGGSLCNLGNIYYSLGDHEKAINYYKQALTVLKLIKHSKFIANTLMGLGDVYYSLGEHEKAIDYYQQSLTIKKKIGDHRGEGHSLGNLGNVYAGLGQFLTAIEYHEKSLIIKREIGDKRGEVNSLQFLVFLYSKVGRMQAGIAASIQAIAIVQELNLPLNVQPYPNWLKSLLRFTQRSKLHLVLCLILGFIASPAILIGLILGLLIILIRALFYRK
jgi:tetratricopeptide (TPR) repeat protein